MKTPTFQNAVRASVILLTIGAALGSLYYFLNASPKNDPLVTKGLYVAWVLSPFVGLLVVESLSEGRSEATLMRLYLLMFLVSMGSVAVYAGFLPLAGSDPLFSYMVVPGSAWVIMGIGILVFGKRTKKRKRKVNS